jgi:Arc/MetJ family transcription regulator
MTKTTIELDEQKLLRVMQLTGIKTRREALDVRGHSSRGFARRPQ